MARFHVVTAEQSVLHSLRFREDPAKLVADAELAKLQAVPENAEDPIDRLAAFAAIQETQGDGGERLQRRLHQARTAL